MLELTEHDRGWLEAAIDGEGSIRLVKRRYITFKSRYPRGYSWDPVTTICNTDYAFLDRIKTIVGTGSILLTHPPWPNKNWKKAWTYSFARKTLREILPQLQLIVKERQRLLVIEALYLVKDHHSTSHRMPDEMDRRLGEIWLEMRQLNQRGKGHPPTANDEADLDYLAIVGPNWWEPKQGQEPARPLQHFSPREA